MFYIYILQSQRNKSFYIGSCKDIKIRLDLHNRGLVKSTKRFIPWIAIYSERFDTLKDARRREKQIKSWKKRDAIEKVIEHSKNL